MVRRSADEKAETNKRILEQASQVFRNEGAHVGIADMMQRLGMTHGAFYRHFETKEEFVVKAAIVGISAFADKLEKIATNAGDRTPINLLIEAYLSEEHLAHPDTWCVIATLAPEVSRLDKRVREELDAALLAYMSKIAPFMPGETVEAQQQTFLVLFSGMAGAISTIRLIVNPDMRQQMLHMFRSHYLATYGTNVK